MRTKKEIKIRTAILKDLNDILNLSSKLISYDYALDRTIDVTWPNSLGGISYFKTQIMAADGLVLVAESDSKIVGFLVGEFVAPLSYRKVQHLAELSEIFVLEEFRGLGIGAMLIKEFLTWCKEKGAERIRVEVSAGNESAIKLYKKLGFYAFDIILEMKS
jgi:ribosomal protein S18 acetylase RimI-like enzyme